MGDQKKPAGFRGADLFQSVEIRKYEQMRSAIVRENSY